MPHPFNRLLLALVAVLALAALLAAPASGVDQVMDQVKESRAVFTGVVESTGASSGTYAMQVKRVYKSDQVGADVALTTSGRQCPVRTGRTYLVFADQFADDEARINGCRDLHLVRGTNDAVLSRVTDILGAGHAPEPAAAQREPAELTRLDDAEPTGFARLAAPGLALVIIGALGLVLVRRMG